MSRRRLKATGKIGFAAPVITLACVFLAVGSSSRFSWTENALSDLGVQGPVTAAIFNTGLVLGGVLFALFTVGLSIYVGKNLVGKAASALLFVASVSLIAIGLFNESFGYVHYLVSVAFFVSLPLSLAVFVAAFWREGKSRLSLFTLALAVVAGLVWGLELTVQFVPGVAIPETISGVAGAVWVWTLSFSLLTDSAAKLPKPVTA
jgi:hypothetical membrane protein